MITFHSQPPQKKTALHLTGLGTTAFLFMETLTCPPLLIQKLYQNCLYPASSYSPLLPLLAVQPFAFDGKIIVQNSVHSAQGGTTSPHITHPLISTYTLLFMWCSHLECASKVPFLGCHPEKTSSFPCTKPRVFAITGLCCTHKANVSDKEPYSKTRCVEEIVH